MKSSSGKWFLPLLWLLLAAVVCLGTGPGLGAEDRLYLTGAVKNAQGKGVKDVVVTLTVNGHPLKPLGQEGDLRTGVRGSFAGEFLLPASTSPHQVAVRAEKPGWRSSGPTPLRLWTWEPEGSDRRTFYAQHQVTLERQKTAAFWLATVILVGVYLLIALEWLHRTLAALLGATLMLFFSYTLGVYDPAFFILSFEDAMRAMDMNVVFLLLGMMLIVGVLKKTGLFQWLALKSFSLARGNIFILTVLFMWVTATVSAFLDNVTTMLLMIPVTLEIALTLKIRPIALLIPEVFASNVGGTATLIGDPPNILIGSYAQLTFAQFIHNLTVICALLTLFSGIYFVFWYRRDYVGAEVKDMSSTLALLRDEYRLADRKLLVLCLGCLGLTIFLFIIHGILDMQPSVAALTGAILLLVLSRLDIVELLAHEVEWPTLVFFMALFMVIAGAEETGLIQFLAEWVKEVSGGSLTVAVVMVLWVSALASAFIDNIPFTATMLPIIAFLNQSLPGADSGVLWWALALGACLGGNGTVIGASANVVTVGLAERAGYPISFLGYMKACFPPMVVTIFLSMMYLLLFY